MRYIGMQFFGAIMNMKKSQLLASNMIVGPSYTG